MRHLSHRNINPLVGACVEPLKTCLLTSYCSKGSLQDVLENDSIKLDQIFKVSFATDIAKVGSFATDIAKVGSFATDIAKVGSFATDIAKVGSFATDIAKVGFSPRISLRWVSGLL